jgi:hypothetical protein
VFPFLNASNSISSIITNGKNLIGADLISVFIFLLVKKFKKRKPLGFPQNLNNMAAVFSVQCANQHII